MARECGRVESIFGSSGKSIDQSYLSERETPGDHPTTRSAARVKIAHSSCCGFNFTDPPRSNRTTHLPLCLHFLVLIQPRRQAKSTKRTDGEQSELVRDNLRRALRPLSPEAVLVLGFPGMLVKTRDTLVS